jgi:hypothetical protein
MAVVRLPREASRAALRVLDVAAALARAEALAGQPSGLGEGHALVLSRTHQQRRFSVAELNWARAALCRAAVFVHAPDAQAAARGTWCVAAR